MSRYQGGLRIGNGALADGDVDWNGGRYDADIVGFNVEEVAKCRASGALAVWAVACVAEER
jgi:hypothetical protein